MHNFSLLVRVVTVLCVHGHTERTHTRECVDCLGRFSFHYFSGWQIYAHATHVERALPSCSIYSLSAFPRNTIGSCRQSYGDLAIPGHPLRALSLICAFDKYLVLDSSGHQEKASRAKRHTFASCELAVARTDDCLGNYRITPIDVRVSDQEQAGQIMSTCD